MYKLLINVEGKDHISFEDEDKTLCGRDVRTFSGFRYFMSKASLGDEDVCKRCTDSLKEARATFDTSLTFVEEEDVPDEVKPVTGRKI